MMLLSLWAALVLEQMRPLTYRIAPYRGFLRYIAYVQTRFDAGERQHGTVAWILAIAPPVFGVTLIYALLHALHPVLGWLWNVVIVYGTMGFKHYRNTATQLSRALWSQDIDTARAVLARWLGREAAHYDAETIARLGVEQTFAYGHKQLFGVVAWFAVFGAAGAVLYRCGNILYYKWGQRPSLEHDAFGAFARRAFHLIDWVPARLTAMSFAVVGNFDDAIYAWRTQAAAWAERNMGVVLAAGAGALGVRLGGALESNTVVASRPELGLNGTPDADTLQSAIALLWRTLLLWLAVIVLLSLAHWFG